MLFSSPSHGENRGSSPLGSANKNNNLNKVSPLLTDRCLLFVYYPRWRQRNIFVDWCPYGAGENKHNHCIAPLEITALGQSWLVSPLAAGLLLGSLLLIALWQAPELLVWLPLARFAAWVMWRCAQTPGRGHRRPRNRTARSSPTYSGRARAVAYRIINATQIHKKKLASQRSRQSIAEHPRGGRQRDRADDGERP